jgi:hypothetical protein
LSELGRTLLIIGLILAAAGMILMFMPRLPFLGKLPGDIIIKKENFSFYFPVTTSVLISLLLMLVSWLFRK